MTDIHRRRLGRTELMISEVGYGAWGIGGGVWGPSDDADSIAALERAIDLGVNFIDTALAYGPHHSERLIGKVVGHRSEEVYVATKVPPKNLIWPAGPEVPVEQVMPGAHIRYCVERSLRNLQAETIDLLQFHVWRDEWLDHGDWQETIAALREEGKLRFFGISVNDGQPGNALRVAASGAVDTIQVVFNIFEQTPADRLLPLCAEHDVGVIARVPFDEGGLTGTLTADTTFPEGDFRTQYFQGERLREVVDRAQAIADELERPLDELAAVALRYVLSNSAVSTVIAGMRTVRNVERNAAVADGRGLPDADVARLQAHRWQRNFYD